MTVRKPLVVINGDVSELPVGDTISGAAGGGGVTVSATAPTSSSNGDLWLNSEDGQLYVYYVDVDTSQWITASSGVTGTLPVANGGTGATTLTANNVLLGNGTSAPLTVAPGTTGNLLTSDGTTWTSSAPPSGGQYLGTATVKAIAYNAQSIAEDITVGSTQNAYSAGPITIDSTYTVTVDSGGTWVII